MLRHCRQSRRRPGLWPALLPVLLLAVLLDTGTARAQSGEDPDETGAAEDGAQAPAGAQRPGLLSAAAAAAAADSAGASGATATTAAATEPGAGYLQGLTFSPVAGVRANVRQYTYYADWTTTAALARAASATQALNWSWEQFRKQEKTVENRKSSLDYNFGQQLPFVTTVRGDWNWSEDRMTNTAGFANLFKVDNKLVNVNATRHKYQALGLTHSMRLGGNFTDQASLNQGQRNDFREGTGGANLQSGWEALPGVNVVGRVAATATGGTCLLAGFTSPSSASGDSLGVGVYVDRGLGSGFIEMTRSNFEKEYLEFRRDANGLIDTVGLQPDQPKVISELETRDAVTMKLDHKLAIGGFKSQVTGAHTTDDVAYATGSAGLKQRTSDLAEVKLGFEAGRDSVGVGWKYGLRWDDQRIKDAPLSRGRQYAQERDLLFNWLRRLFRNTNFAVQYHEGLTQDISQDPNNKNDKDRLMRDFSTRIDRNWPGRFRAAMVFAWRQTQDISIRGSSSSNNNIKDSYEVSPGYTWELAPWITLDQSYRLYIQYTDYLYSYLETVTREDDYSKRGDLVTKVTCKPNERLSITVRHDSNRRFNATKTSEDASGNAFYHRDLEQDIAKIDLDLVYVAGPGVTLEASTYRTRDDKTSIGRATTQTRTDSGELVVGGRVERKWGARQQVEVSAMVKKISAFGPSITASSSDFWEADVWFKWLF